jgi:hypothetical protein
MPVNWSTQQQQMAAALLDPDHAVPSGIEAPQGLERVRHFNAYRNNVVTSLSDALAAAYPVVTQLVGDEFMRQMAAVFVRLEPPRTPVLIDYGSGFADFLATFSPVSGLPYLSDVARLEWAWGRAYHAADHAPLGIEALANMDQSRLGAAQAELLPSAQLLAFDHPAVSIWAAHQQSDDAVDLSRIEAQPEWALIVRPAHNVDVRAVSEPLFTFLSALQTGKSLADALELIGETELSPPDAIAALFETGVLATFTLPPHHQSLSEEPS